MINDQQGNANLFMVNSALRVDQLKSNDINCKHLIIFVSRKKRERYEEKSKLVKLIDLLNANKLKKSKSIKFTNLIHFFHIFLT